MLHRVFRWIIFPTCALGEYVALPASTAIIARSLMRNPINHLRVDDRTRWVFGRTEDVNISIRFPVGIQTRSLQLKVLPQFWHAPFCNMSCWSDNQHATVSFHLDLEYIQLDFQHVVGITPITIRMVSAGRPAYFSVFFIRAILEKYVALPASTEIIARSHRMHSINNLRVDDRTKWVSGRTEDANISIRLPVGIQTRSLQLKVLAKDWNAPFRNMSCWSDNQHATVSFHLDHEYIQLDFQHVVGITPITIRMVSAGRPAYFSVFFIRAILEKYVPLPALTTIKTTDSYASHPIEFVRSDHDQFWLSIRNTTAKISIRLPPKIRTRSLQLKIPNKFRLPDYRLTVYGKGTGARMWWHTDFAQVDFGNSVRGPIEIWFASKRPIRFRLYFIRAVLEVRRGRNRRKIVAAIATRESVSAASIRTVAGIATATAGTTSKVAPAEILSSTAAPVMFSTDTYASTTISPTPIAAIAISTAMHITTPNPPTTTTAPITTSPANPISVPFTRTTNISTPTPIQHGTNTHRSRTTNISKIAPIPPTPTRSHASANISTTTPFLSTENPTGSHTSAKVATTSATNTIAITTSTAIAPILATTKYIGRHTAANGSHAPANVSAIDYMLHTTKSTASHASAKLSTATSTTLTANATGSHTATNDSLASTKLVTATPILPTDKPTGSLTSTNISINTIAITISTTIAPVRPTTKSTSNDTATKGSRASINMSTATPIVPTKPTGSHTSANISTVSTILSTTKSTTSHAATSGTRASANISTVSTIQPTTKSTISHTATSGTHASTNISTTNTTAIATSTTIDPLQPSTKSITSHTAANGSRAFTNTSFAIPVLTTSTMNPTAANLQVADRKFDHSAIVVPIVCASAAVIIAIWRKQGVIREAPATQELLSIMCESSIVNMSTVSFVDV